MRMQNLAGLWQGPGNRGRQYGPADVQAEAELEAQVAAAHREWQAAQNYFQMVCEPDLVDHAIYNLEAAQRKYMYLFRLLRERRRQQVGSAGDAPWM